MTDSTHGDVGPPRLASVALGQFVPAAVGAGAALLAASLIARNVDPSTFGMYLSSGAVIAVTGVLVDMGTTTSGLQRATSDPGSVRHLAWAVIRLRCFAYAVLVGPLYLLLTVLYPQSDFVFKALLLASGAVPVVSADWLLLARQEAGRLHVARLCGPVVTALALVPPNADLRRLTEARITGALLTSLVVWYQTSLRLPVLDRDVRPTHLAASESLLKESIPLFVSSGFAQLYTSRLDQVILSKARPAREVGAYGAIYTLYSGAIMPLQTVLTWYLPVLIRSAAIDSGHEGRGEAEPSPGATGVKLQETDPTDFSSVVGLFRRHVMSVSIGLAVVFTLIAPLAQRVLFPRFSVNLPVVLLLAASLPFVGAGACFGYPLLAQRKNRRLGPVAPCGAAANVAANLALAPLWGPVGCAASMVVGELVMFATSFVRSLESRNRRSRLGRPHLARSTNI